jgi:hypothetical protein
MSHAFEIIVSLEIRNRGKLLNPRWGSLWSDWEHRQQVTGACDGWLLDDADLDVELNWAKIFGSEWFFKTYSILSSHWNMCFWVGPALVCLFVCSVRFAE